MSKWSDTKRLSELFKNGEPSNNPVEYGLLIHGFDGTENWASSATWKGWFPCSTGFCQNSKKWWSGSIINAKLRNTFSDSAIILSPHENVVMCSFGSDAGTLTAGCSRKGGGYHAANETKEMLQAHMRFGGSGYNEVMIDTKAYVENLPKSVAAIVYGLKGVDLPRDKLRAHQVYVSMLDRYNLTEASFPLLEVNYTQIVDPVTGPDPINGPAFVDVSAGARQYVHDAASTAVGSAPQNPLRQENPLEQEKWDRAHPNIKDSPEHVYRWMRASAKVSVENRKAHPGHDGA
jgi:hypothetical protein